MQATSRLNVNWNKNIPSFGTLEVWLDASQYSLADGVAVSSLTNLAGNGKDFVQADVAKQPVFKVSAANGKPGILFDGTNDLLQVASTEYNSFSIYGVFKATAGSTRIILERGPNTNTHVGEALAQTTGATANVNRAGAGLVHRDCPVSTWATAANISFLRFVYSQSAGMYYWKGNNWSLSAACAGSTASVTTTLNIGARENGTFAYAGHIMELIIYKEAHSESVAQTITDGLFNKWAA